MNDSEYSARRRGLIAQLREFERSAGIADAADVCRKPAESSANAARETGSEESVGDRPADAHSLLGDDAQRRSIRSLYFSVAHSVLRKRLIAKQRELSLFERTGIRTNLEDVRRHRETLGRRPAEGWWIAAIVGSSLVIVGYALFAIFGAIAGAVAALFVGNGIEQSARRRFEHALAVADDDLSAATSAASTAEQTRDLFSEHESATGVSDSAPESPAMLIVTAH